MKSLASLELKYFCKDFAAVRTALKEIGAKKVIVKKQKDYFFNLPKNNNSKVPPRLKLRVEGKKQTLIFYQRASFSTTTNTPSDIILLPIQDSKILSFLSRVLGVRVVVEKTRELWKKENTIFHLDTVKDVGNIFEIEVWSSPKTELKDSQKFAEYKRKLLPYLDKIIKGSNENLALKASKKK